MTRAERERYVRVIKRASTNARCAKWKTTFDIIRQYTKKFRSIIKISLKFIENLKAGLVTFQNGRIYRLQFTD
jgi:hypothetical protein